MDPVLKSTLTTLATSAVGYILGSAVTRHYLTPDQASVLTTDLVSGGLIAIGGLLTWYKASQHTQKAQIAAVNNSDNGVSAVSTRQAIAAGVPMVSGPLK